MNNKELANIIDHTLLKADATQAEIIKLCAEAKEFNFASVCVNPSMVKLASEELKGCDVDVCTVIGFPLGATTSEVKAFEVKNTIENGATEVDMVINIGKLKDRDLVYVKNDIKAVGSDMGVKASGGVRTREDAMNMVENGATRIGASASIAIATGTKQETKGY